MPHTIHHGITMKPADNGGYNLKWNTQVQGLKRSDTYYKDHIEVFNESEEDKGFGRMQELYKENFANHKKMMSKGNKKKEKTNSSSHGSSHPEPGPY